MLQLKEPSYLFPYNRERERGDVDFEQFLAYLACLLLVLGVLYITAENSYDPTNAISPIKQPQDSQVMTLEELGAFLNDGVTGTEDVLEKVMDLIKEEIDRIPYEREEP